MNIGIIGRGVVGQAVYTGLEMLGHKMSYFDIKDSETQLSDILDTEIVFICVPTLSTLYGECDTGIVEKVCRDLAVKNYRGIVAIKSTVIPGTTEKLGKRFTNLQIIFVPEFLRAASALEDFCDNHEVLVVGAHKTETFETLAELHGHYPKLVRFITPTEAELVKYFNNVHNAMNCTFANIFFEVCKKFGANYDNVLHAISERTNISPTYLKSNSEYRAFGGACLPKDTAAFNILLSDLKLDYSLIDSILMDNEKFK
jgi:UDPglucose 6-dehydrogenase